MVHALGDLVWLVAAHGVRVAHTVARIGRTKARDLLGREVVHAVQHVGRVDTVVVWKGEKRIQSVNSKKDWNDTWKPNFEAVVETDMQVIPSPP